MFSRIRTVPIALAVLAAGAAAYADGIDTNDPSLPPDGVYLSPDDVHAMYTAGDLEVVLNKPQHKPIADRVDRSNQGADEHEFFQSTLAGDGTIVWPSMGIPTPQTVPFSAQGPVHTVVFGKVGNVTGTFDTEMLSMDLTGASPLGPFMIRESPTLPSIGKTSITDLGGGMYHIDSFFDVFTELSLDGVNWIPSSGPARVNLVPEPSSVALMAMGIAGLAGMWWRRRRAA
jgi:hypothetical protein